MSRTPVERRSRRRPILETFSVFISIPKKGGHRLRITDVSETDIGFELDTEGESHADFKVTKGEVLEIHFYLNQSLYIPMSVSVMRIDDQGSVRKIGGQLVPPGSPGTAALGAFLSMLDSIVDTARVERK